jgi:hypothetical protein
MAITALLLLITALGIFLPGLPWSARARHTLKRVIVRTEIRLAKWRGEDPRLASITGHINLPGVEIEALDSRSGLAALTDNEGNFVLPDVMWYPGATYELVVHENETGGKLIEVTGPLRLPDSGQFNIGEPDIGHAVRVQLPALIGLNSITLEDFDSKDREYYKELFDKLTAGTQSDQQKIEAINNYVATRLNYDETQTELGSPRRVLDKGSQYCAHLCIAMQTLLSIGGYRSRAIHMSDGRKPPGTHAAVEVLYDGSWHLYDPTYGLIFRKSDGEVASYRDVRLNTGLISEGLLAKFPANVKGELMTLLPAVYGTGYHHVFYFRGEQWSASKAQPTS